MINVIFVGSENSGKLSPVIENQAKSLIEQGINIFYFGIIGRGIRGYLSNILPFRNSIKERHIDIIHAHYIVSALVPTLSLTRKPIVVSLMGSDIYDNIGMLPIIRFLIKHCWSKTIVKSSKMKQLIKIPSVEVIPNGVDFSCFFPIDQLEAKGKVGFEKTKKQIIFVSNPDRKEKNYQLALLAVGRLKNSNIELIPLYNIPNTELPDYYNAADIMLMTSTHEGSPNAIKEAMACNCPVVATEVGDIDWLLGNERGHFITEFDPEDVAEKIKLALAFSEKHGRTKGRERIIALGLDSRVIAAKIVDVYNNMIQK